MTVPAGPATPAMRALTAVVFDTNCMPGGTVHVDKIRQWARTCSRFGVKLWLPEVVLWELWHHLDVRIAAGVQAVRAYNKTLTLLEMDPAPEPRRVSREELRELLCSAGARIIPIDPEDALEALLDQVAQRGPGSTKSDVKTGAADSAWLRSVHRHNGGTFEGLLLVTADGGAVDGIVELLGGTAPAVVKHLGELNAHFGTEPATGDERERLKVALATYMGQLDQDVVFSVLRHASRRWSQMGVAHHAMKRVGLSDWQISGQVVRARLNDTLQAEVTMHLRAEATAAWRQEDPAHSPVFADVTVVALVALGEEGVSLTHEESCTVERAGEAEAID